MRLSEVKKIRNRIGKNKDKAKYKVNISFSIISMNLIQNERTIEVENVTKIIPTIINLEVLKGES